MIFDFSKISTTNPETSVEYLQRHFLNQPASFFLDQTTDRQIEFLLNSPNKKLLQITSKIYLFLLSPNNLFVCNLKVFILTKQELLTPFLISRRKLTKSYSKLLPTISATCRLFCCTFYDIISIDVSKKVYMILFNLCICIKNVASSRRHYL